MLLWARSVELMALMLELCIFRMLATFSSRLLMNGVAEANSIGGVNARLIPFRRHTAVLSPLVWPTVRMVGTLEIMAARLPTVVLGLLLLRPCNIVIVFRGEVRYRVETLDSR